MRNFTNEEIKALAPYEEIFRKVIDMGYKRATPQSVNDMVADMWENASGRRLQRNWSCGHCLKTAWELCGNLYFKSKAEAVEEAVKEDEKEGVNLIDKIVRKVGRPRKS